MEEVKLYYIRNINKIRRKIINVICKINHDKKTGQSIYKNYLFKFQQLDNTLMILEDQIKDLNDVYTNIKNNNNNYVNNNFKPLNRDDITLLLPIFIYYFNHLKCNNEHLIPQFNYNLDGID